MCNVNVILSDLILPCLENRANAGVQDCNFVGRNPLLREYF
jgi:hypothetical protein